MKLWLAAVLLIAGIQSAMRNPQSAIRNPQSRSIWDRVYTADQAKRGQAAYSAQCSSCHGAMLDGIDAAPALLGGGFLARWDGVNLGDMVERIRVSMPLSNPGSLGRQQVADVLSYILSVNGMPPGDAELAAEPARLSQIVFKAAKSP